MGQLVLENMEFYAYHGHYEEEQIIGGQFRVDIVIDTDISKAAGSDALNDALDYSMIYDLIRKEMIIPSRLLEHLAKRITDMLYTMSPGIEKITVTVSKLNPPVGGKMEKFSVVYSK